MSKLKSRDQKIVYYIALAAMFFNSNTFWCNSNSTLGVLFAVVGICSMLLYKRYIQKKYIILILSLFLFLFSNMLMTGSLSYFGMNIRMLIVFALAFFIAVYMDYDFFKEAYINILTGFTTIALIVYILVVFMGKTTIIESLPLLKNANGVMAYNGVLFCVYTYRYDRVMSIFWEPSIYSTFANIALLFLLIFNNHSRFKLIKSIILCVGIIASKSTGGYLLLIIIMVFSFIVRSKRNKTKQFWLLVGGIFACFIICNKDFIIDSLIYINPEVFYKLDVSAKSSSLITRMASGIINLKIFLQNPFVGVGIGNIDSLYISMGGKNQTSTITYYLAAFGIAGIVPILTMVASIIRQKKMFWIYKMILIGILTYVLYKEPYWFSCGMYTIIMMLFFNQENHSKLEFKARYEKD